MKKNEHSETLRIAVLRVSGKPVRGYRLPLFNSDAPGQTQPLRGHKDQLTVTQQGAEEDPVKKARQEAKYLKGDVLKTNLNKKRLTAAWKTNLNSRFCCLDFGVHLSSDIIGSAPSLMKKSALTINLVASSRIACK